MMFNNE